MNTCPTKRFFIFGLAFILLALGPSAAAPADGPEKNGNGNGNATAPTSDFLTDFTRGPDAFPHFLQPYRERPIAPVVIENSRRLRDLIRDGKLELSLADALALALENNLDIGVQRYVIPLAKTDVLRARSGQAARGFSGAFVPGGLSAGAIGAGVSGDSGARGTGSAGGITGGGGAVTIGPSGTFDPSVTFNFSWDRVTSPLNTLQVAGIPTVTSYATALSGTYSQLLPTGTSYFLGINGLRQSSTQQFLRFNPAVISRFAVGFHQPILNGFGTLSNERFVLVARNNQKVSEEIFRLQVVNTVVRVENIYWDMAAFQENVKVAEQSLAVAEKLLRDNQIRSDIGTMAPLDVLSAESEVAARQRDLIVSRTNLQLQEATLKSILTKKSDPELENVRIVTTDPLPEVRDADVDIQNALTTAYENRPDLRQAETNFANQQIAARFTENNLKPSFAVFGMYAGSGLQGNALGATGGASDSLRQSFVGDFPELAGGTTINIPLRNRAAQADDIRAQLERNQLEISLQRLRNQIGLEVRQAGIGLLQGKAQVGAANQAVILARQTHEGEQKKLAEGVSTSYQEILRARDLVSAQLAAVQARAAYAKALVEMERAMGTTLERNGIQLNDALTGNVTNMPTPAFQLGGGRKAAR